MNKIIGENNFQSQLFDLVKSKLISFIFEITQNYIVNLFKVIGRKHVCKISPIFTCKHKINESNVPVLDKC